MSKMHSGPAGVNPTRVYPHGEAPTESEPAGRIEVSTRAISTVAGRAVAQCYGVVGIAARHPRFVPSRRSRPNSMGAASRCVSWMTM